MHTNPPLNNIIIGVQVAFEIGIMPEDSLVTRKQITRKLILINKKLPQYVCSVDIFTPTRT